MSDKFHDECAVVAIFAHPEAEKLAYLGLHALQQDRFKHRARSIDRSRVTGRTGPDNHDLCVGDLAHARRAPKRRTVVPVRVG